LQFWLQLRFALIVFAVGGVGPQGAGHAVGADNLCHQAIFVDHAASAVTPPDPDVVWVGDTVGQWAQWRCLPEGSVRPVGVTEVLVLAQDGHQVPLVPDQGPVEQFSPGSCQSSVP
jgi:hypothetical protein